MITKEQTPQSGSKIFVGILDLPDTLFEYEFIAVTSEDLLLYWKNDRTDTCRVSREFAYLTKRG